MRSDRYEPRAELRTSYRDPPQAEAVQYRAGPSVTWRTILADGFANRSWQRFAGAVGLAVLFGACVVLGLAL